MYKDSDINAVNQKCRKKRIEVSMIVEHVGENRLDPEKSCLKPVLQLHSPFLLPSFFLKGREKGKK